MICTRGNEEATVKWRLVVQLVVDIHGHWVQGVDDDDGDDDDDDDDMFYTQQNKPMSLQPT